MGKAKFKVGDKVKIRQWDDMEKEYGLTPNGHINRKIVFSTYMRYLCGETATITGIDGDCVSLKFNAKVRNTGWNYKTYMLEPLNDETIVIYRNGSEVVAVNKLTGKKGVAKCSPLDEFDFETGAKLRFERLITPEPKLYNGKVICTDSKAWKYYTTGKIYQFKDGKATFDNGFTFKNDFEKDPVKTFEDWVKRSGAKWLEVVE